MSTIFRVVKNCNYTTLSNYHFKDKRLSWKAKGLLSTMLSLPDDWNYTIEGLSKLSDDGIKSTNSGLLELEKCGYLVRKQTRNSNGYFGLTEYIIYEQPVEKNTPEQELPEPQSDHSSQPLCQNGQTAENTAFQPYVQNRQTEKRFAEKGGQLNTNILNTKELNNTSSSSMDVQERMRKTQVLDEEEENLRERLAIEHIASKCSYKLVESVLSELCKRDNEFIRLIDARAFEQICLAIMDKQRQEPVRMLPNLINTYLDNIMLGIKAAGSGGSSNGGRDSPLHYGRRKNDFNNFQQNHYDFSTLEKELLGN